MVNFMCQEKMDYLDHWLALLATIVTDESPDSMILKFDISKTKKRFHVGKGRPDSSDIALRNAEAVSMRLQGMRYTDIGRTLGISKHVAYRACKKAGIIKCSD